MKVKGFVRSRMRESRTYGSVRGGYRKVSVYSIAEEENGEYWEAYENNNRNAMDDFGFI